MPRPRINGDGRKKRTYQRIGVPYARKKEVLDHLRISNNIDMTIDELYGTHQSLDRRATKKQIRKWQKAETTIRSACEAGKGAHRNLRQLGEGSVLSPEAEEQIVLWINSIRKDGAPVSRLMLRLKAKEVAGDCGLDDDLFSASDTWIKLFLRRHKLSLRARTRQGQTTPEDARSAASAFRAQVLQTLVEHQCMQVFNADQTAVFFEYLPKRTIDARGSKTVWIKCGNKDKERATAMLLGDWTGKKYDPFILFKSAPAKGAATQTDNNATRNGFGVRVWKEIRVLQERHSCQIYGNKAAWWNSDLSIKFLQYHFADRDNGSDLILLLWDDFSAHWTKDVVNYAASINVILLKVPPRYTYVCQPADISWNQPFKARLRGQWVERLRTQLTTYTRDEVERQRQREVTKGAITRAQMDLDQHQAEELVIELCRQQTATPFKLVPPTRSDIAHWITLCWFDLSVATIVSGFAKPGLLTDTRVFDHELEEADEARSLVESLQRINLTGEAILSDDDIGSSSEADDAL